MILRWVFSRQRTLEALLILCRRLLLLLSSFASAAGRPQDGPKIAQDGPEMAPRWPQDGPKMAPEAPKMAQDCPRWPKMPQARLQKIIKNHMGF